MKLKGNLRGEVGQQQMCKCTCATYTVYIHSHVEHVSDKKIVYIKSIYRYTASHTVDIQSHLCIVHFESVFDLLHDCGSQRLAAGRRR